MVAVLRAHWEGVVVTDMWWNWEVDMSVVDVLLQEDIDGLNAVHEEVPLPGWG